MASIYGAKAGCPSYPLLTLFRSLLLGIWYRLSDEQLAQYLFWDLLFQRFCRLELDGTVPDSKTIGRFRIALVTHDVWELLLAEVNRQLEAKHVIITEGRAKDLTFFGTAEIAHNVQKAVWFLQRLGVPDLMPTR